MCRDILALYHRVDALVLCAGVSHTGLFCDMTDEQWRTVMDVNVSGMFYLIRALAPGMIARNEGAIVTVLSPCSVGIVAVCSLSLLLITTSFLLSG